MILINRKIRIESYLNNFICGNLWSCMSLEIIGNELPTVFLIIHENLFVPICNYELKKTGFRVLYFYSSYTILESMIQFDDGANIINNNVVIVLSTRHDY